MDLAPGAQQEGRHSASHLVFDFWEAPQDPDRPLLPYNAGFSAQIFRHIGELEDLALEQRPELTEGYLRTVTQSEAIVANLTTEEIRGPSSQAETAQLVITSPIATGSTRGAQVVACTVTPQDGHPFAAAAKIYDPLYYDFEHCIGHWPRNCVREADQDFLVESFAYENLEKAGQTGSFAPEYYGAWWFTLPIVVKGKLITRPVRLILMERLNGTSIRESSVHNRDKGSPGMDAFPCPETWRLEVLARAMDGYVRQMNVGVEQDDFAGRNIVLVTNETPITTSESIGGLVLPRIVLIDYNNACAKCRSSDELDPRPTNPALRFWCNYLWEDFSGWVPNTWRKSEFQNDWLLRRFCGHGQRELYRPVPEWMDRLVKQKDPGPSKDHFGHAPVTGAGSIPNEEVGFNISHSGPHGSDEEVQAGSPPEVKLGPGCEL